MCISDWMQSGAVIITAGVAVYGITTWRREYLGKRKIELAEEILALFYEAQDAISAIRSPFGFGGEGQTRKAAPGDSDEERNIYDRAFTTRERYNKRSELFSKLFSMRYRFMAVFGKASMEPFDILRKIIAEILVTSDYIAEYWIKQQMKTWESKKEYEQHLEEMRKHESVIWEGVPDRDTIKPRVDQMIKGIEALCLKVIDNKQQKGIQNE